MPLSCRHPKHSSGHTLCRNIVGQALTHELIDAQDKAQGYKELIYQGLPIMFALVGRLVALIILAGLPVGLVAQVPSSSVVRPRLVQPQALPGYGELPLGFELNQGQAPPAVDFLAHGAGFSVALLGPGVMYSTGLRLDLAGAASHPLGRGEEQLPGQINYLIGRDPGKWRIGIPTFGRIRYPNVYPAIDLIYHGSSRALEYDFELRPGASSSEIRLAFHGAGSVQIDPSGDLVIQTPVGQLTQRRPVAYLQGLGPPTQVPVRFVLDADGRAGFAVGVYDKTRPLVIDPKLVYSTYLGGRSNDYITGVAVDSAGNAYVTGETTSNDFPTTPGSLKPNCSVCSYSSYYGTSNSDAFVSKLNASGSALIYSTYLGGNTSPNDWNINYGQDLDRGQAIAVDANGDAYVAGYTDSTDFPVTSNAYQSTYGYGVSDGFLAKLNAQGSGVLYGTYFGKDAENQPHGIALDADGNIYLAGWTSSANFPVTANAIQPAKGQAFADAFALKFTAAGTLAYSTYLGDGDPNCPPQTLGWDIALDAGGDAFVVGQTFACASPPAQPFPTTSGAYQAVNKGLDDLFISKLNPTGTGLLYSTLLGGSDEDGVDAAGIAVDAAGDAYVTAFTQSHDFPTTAGAFQTTFQGGLRDGFVTKFNATGTQLVYSTFLGGEGDEFPRRIAVDSVGDAYVIGATWSQAFPMVEAFQGPDPYLPCSDPCMDGFIAKLAPNGSALIYASYLGGTFGDMPLAIALDGGGNAYVAGDTFSPDFPTVAAEQSAYRGGDCGAFITSHTESGPPWYACGDGFITKIAPPGTAGFLTSHAYFAEGYTGSGFSEELDLAMPNGSGTADILYYLEPTACSSPPCTVHPAPRTLNAGQVTKVSVNSDVGPNHQVSARVTFTGTGAGLAERVMHFANSLGHGSTDKVGTPAPRFWWNFAEGSTYPFFNEYLTLQNPGTDTANYSLTYYTDAGQSVVRSIVLPPESRTTVEVFSGSLSQSYVASCVPNGPGANCGVGRGVGGVSVQIISNTEPHVPIVAERTFYVLGHDFGSGPINDAHAAFGVEEPTRNWYFAEGTTLNGFAEYLTLENPYGADDTADLHYFTENGQNSVKTVRVPKNSRVTVEVFKGDPTTAQPNCVANGPGATCGVGPNVVGVSVFVQSTGDIVVERPMYIVHDFGSGTVAGADDVVGANAPVITMGFAAVSTVAGTNAFLTIENPDQSRAATVQVAYYVTAGPAATKTIIVPAGSRHTVEIFNPQEGIGPGYASVAVVVTSIGTPPTPVLVEKPAYSALAGSYGATDTFGAVPPASF